MNNSNSSLHRVFEITPAEQRKLKDGPYPSQTVSRQAAFRLYGLVSSIRRYLVACSDFEPFFPNGEGQEQMPSEASNR